jgi:hypothetical protein
MDLDPFRRRMLLYLVVLILAQMVTLPLMVAYHTYPAYNVTLVVINALTLLVFGSVILRYWLRNGAGAIRRPVLLAQVLLLATLAWFLAMSISRLG